MNNLKQLLKKNHSLYSLYLLFAKGKKRIQFYFSIKKAKREHKKALYRLKGKECITCVYFVLHKSVWKFDGVYKLMQTHPRFKPIILVCPIVDYGRENMLSQMEDSYIFFKSKGYRVMKAYDMGNDSYLDVMQVLHPDIIVYTNPYKSVIDEHYYISNYMNVLSLYVHYGFNSVTEWDFLYKRLLTNIVWRYYVETPSHLSYLKDHSLNGGVNGVVTGYPGIEDLINPCYEIEVDPWKIGDRTIKRIIWAPHHTIEAVGNICFSNFLKYSKFMLKLADKYKSQIQIAFKPHPTLKQKLYKVWGEEMTDNYYELWNTTENTMLADGEYIDLFLTSDAMIHDSGSFLIEYLYVQKPVMRTMNDDNFEGMLNSFAKRCFEVYYKGYNENDVEKFVVDIINGIDSMKETRELQFNKDLSLINNNLPSQNIIADILDSIDNQILYRN